MSERGAWSAWAEKRWDERREVRGIKSGPARPLAGWYTDPELADTLRYWDGKTWTKHTAPAPPRGPGGLSGPPTGPMQPDAQIRATVSVVVFVAAAIGFVMANQETSLLNGTTNLWIGAILACAAVGGGWVFRAYVLTWVWVLAVVAAVLAVTNVLHVEHQMSERRDEISRIFDD